MTNINVGDRVYFIDHNDEKWFGNVISISEARQIDNKYCVQLDEIKQPIYIGENKLFKE